MESHTEKVKTVKLVLNEKEAAWLKGLIQNPIGTNQRDEPEHERIMRSAFWKALGGN